MFDAEEAKREVCENIRREWQINWMREYRRTHLLPTGQPFPQNIKIPEPPQSVYPTEWVTHTWDTGGIVMPYHEFIKLKKSIQNKIMKL